MKVLLYIIAHALLWLTSPLFADTPCHKIKEVCLEGPSTKIIQDLPVHRSCWRYQAEFECATNHYLNQCGALESHPQCTVVHQACSEKDSDGACRIWQKRFVCGNLLEPKDGVVLLESRYTVVKDEQDTKACEAIQQNPNCTLVKETCTEGEETRTINGKPIHKTCWRYNREYSCLGAMQSDCDKLPKDCQKEKSSCITFDEKNPTQCLAWEHQYRCPEKAIGQAPIALNCSDQKFCLNGNCYDTGYQTSPDFTKAISHLSVLKDMQGKLDPESLKLFNGKENACRKWPLNSMDCCNDSGWANEVLVSCKDNEKQLYQDRKDKRVHYLGSHCSKKRLGGICVEKKKSFCVFDSKLARIVHEQGRGQLGMGWGSPKHPECRGFTAQELQKLNFEKMDLSEYTEDVWQKTKLPKNDELIQKAGQQVQKYYEQKAPHALR